MWFVSDKALKDEKKNWGWELKGKIKTLSAHDQKKAIESKKRLDQKGN